VHKNSTSGQISVVAFEGDHFQIVDYPQEVWPFLETGRTLNTFDKIAELGQGGCGTVFKVQHKLDGRIYALKKIKMHVEFDPDAKKPIHNHPAMKEIEAISKL